MKAQLLFSHKLKPLGWLLALPGFALGYLSINYNYNIPGFGMQLRSKAVLFLPMYENFTNELALALIVAGLVLVAFSRQKREDELTAKIRLNALYWSILINYACYMLLFVTALVNTVLQTAALQAIIDYMTNNLNFLVYNLFTPLVIFIARFYYLIYKSGDEYDIKPVRFLPNKPFRIIGVLATAGMLAAIAMLQIVNDDDGTDLLYILPAAMLVWVYSKERQEDEYISSIRLHAMQIAVYVNYIILLLANVFVYGPAFIYVLLFNLATIPAIFLLVFNYRLYKIRQQGKSNLTLGVL
jgi:hypothetical protein